MIFRRFDTMSQLLLSILGLSAALPHCPMWQDIKPCTCRTGSSQLISITCEKMDSFEQIVNLFRGHFAPTGRASFALCYSKIDDLQFRSFKELNLSIENLKLNHDNIMHLSADSFDGMTAVTYLSLADNELNRVPEQLWKKMPNLKTLDMGRTKISHLSETSFRDLQHLQVLVLAGNHITRMDRTSIPSIVQRLHLGRNMIGGMNQTLLDMSELVWLFVNANNLTTLDNELPLNAPNLRMVHASNNRLVDFPHQFRTYPYLDTIFLEKNLLTSLDGTLSKSRNLRRLVLFDNHISILREDDFAECELMESLLLSHNKITAINGSLTNLVSLNFVNLTYNLLEEFSFQEIIGLQELRGIDLSYNRIKRVIGPTANLVEWNIKLAEIKLDHNEIESLNGSLSGLRDLLRLNLSYNRLTHIAPDDLLHLDQLRLLDISHNYITTLEETSKTFLPRLEELRASHNLLTILDKDFHGLPELCYADLSNNKIVALGRDLVSKTKCKVGHGVHEGAYDALKIDLQNNPILCDAALGEIKTAMQVNRTIIFGVSYNCAPLSEQPTTSKPNRFLGYIPKTASTPPTQPAVISQDISKTQPLEEAPDNQVQVNPFLEPNYQSLPLAINEPEQPQRLEEERTSNLGENLTNDPQEFIQKTAETHHFYNSNENTPRPKGEPNQLIQEKEPKPLTPKQPVGQQEDIQLKQSDQPSPTSKPPTGEESESMQGDEPARHLKDPESQESQLSKMASQIEILRTQLQQLADQNQLLAKNLSSIISNSSQSKEHDRNTRRPLDDDYGSRGP